MFLGRFTGRSVVAALTLWMDPKAHELLLLELLTFCVLSPRFLLILCASTVSRSRLLCGLGLLRLLLCKGSTTRLAAPARLPFLFVQGVGSPAVGLGLFFSFLLPFGVSPTLLTSSVLKAWPSDAVIAVIAEPSHL